MTFEDYMLDHPWVIFVIIFGAIGCVLIPLIWYDFQVEYNLVDKMNCNQIYQYITNNSHSGYVAKWQYNDRCVSK